MTLYRLVTEGGPGVIDALKVLGLQVESPSVLVYGTYEDCNRLKNKLVEYDYPNKLKIEEEPDTEKAQLEMLKNFVRRVSESHTTPEPLTLDEIRGEAQYLVKALDLELLEV